MSWDKAAKYYSSSNSSFRKNIMEHEINYLSIEKLLDFNSEISILDAGCGDGGFILKLNHKFKNISGCDYSAEMIKIARIKCPGADFFIWNMEKKCPCLKSNYDAIISKLVLMFIDNIDNVATEFFNLLNKGGAVIISVIHPMYWMNQFILNKYGIKKEKNFNRMRCGYYSSIYITNDIADDENLRFKFKHRTFQDYINAFTKAGFFLDRIDEPKMSNHFLRRHPDFMEKSYIPTRLNMRFIKL